MSPLPSLTEEQTAAMPTVVKKIADLIRLYDLSDMDQYVEFDVMSILSWDMPDTQDSRPSYKHVPAALYNEYGIRSTMRDGALLVVENPEYNPKRETVYDYGVLGRETPSNPPVNPIILFALWTPVIILAGIALSVLKNGL